MAQQAIKLMIPGPVEVDPKVLAATGAPVEPHYGDAWVKKYSKVLAMLKQVFNTDYDVFFDGRFRHLRDRCLHEQRVNER